MELEEQEPQQLEPKPRALACKTCGYPLRTFDSNDTSTWRQDDFCSARCKARSRVQVLR